MVLHLERIEIKKGEEKEEGTAMNDVEMVLEEFETPDHAISYSCKDVLWDTDGLEFVEGACVHVLHAIVDTRLDEKCTVEFNDFRSDCTMEDIEFHDDSI